MIDSRDGKAKGRVVCVVILIMGALNFFSFVGISIYLGGDASGGRTKDGHYYN